GWFAKLKTNARRSPHAAEMQRVLDYVGGDGKEIHWDLTRALMRSAANTVIFPVQDVLGLGAEHRMNVPGTAAGNWRWRVKANALTDEVARKLSRMTHVFGRV